MAHLQQLIQLNTEYQNNAASRLAIDLQDLRKIANTVHIDDADRWRNALLSASDQHVKENKPRIPHNVGQPTYVFSTIDEISLTSNASTAPQVVFIMLGNTGPPCITAISQPTNLLDVNFITSLADWDPSLVYPYALTISPASVQHSGTDEFFG